MCTTEKNLYHASRALARIPCLSFGILLRHSAEIGGRGKGLGVVIRVDGGMQSIFLFAYSLDSSIFLCFIMKIAEITGNMVDMQGGL